MIRFVTLAWQSRGLLVVGKLTKDTIGRVAAGTAVLLAAAGLAAGAAAGPALAAGQGRASMAQPALASSQSWQVVKKVPGEDFSAVVATGRNGGWAFGSGMPGANPRPTAWRRSGPSWTRVPFPGQREEVVITAAATSASDVWAFTTGGARSLTTVAIPGGPSRTSIATVARIPGTSEALAGGFTHAAGNAGLDDAGVLLEYES
jgi:hypothetical protein